MLNISFKKATTEDILTIQALANKIWRAHYSSIISMEQIDFMLEMMYSTHSLQKQMNEKKNFTLVFLDQIPTGYFSISETSPKYFFLHKFYIDTHQHRKGIGSKAFEHLLENDALHFEEIKLQVNRENQKAVSFYFKNGFKILEEKIVQIGNGFVMDDYFLIKKK